MKIFLLLSLLAVFFSGCGNVIVDPRNNDVSSDVTIPTEDPVASPEEKQAFLHTVRSLEDVGELREGIFSLNEKAVSLGIFYNDVFDFSTEAEWIDIETADVRLKIPFSPEWNIVGTPVAAFDSGINLYNDSESSTVAAPFVRFGMFDPSGISYAVREYYLEILPKDMVITGPVTTLEAYAAGQCPFEGVAPPTTVTIGNYTGVTYLYGGSKGCSTVFATMVKDRVFFLYKRSVGAAGTDGEHEVSEEMRRIIESIRLK